MYKTQLYYFIMETYGTRYADNVAILSNIHINNWGQTNRSQHMKKKKKKSNPPRQIGS